jgi:hypothetical protein
MPQSGYTPIQLYSSSTTGNSPSAGNLTNDTKGAELAVNIADGKLFYKDTSNNVQILASGSEIYGGAPVTVASNYTVATNVTWVINNKSGSSLTVTLPTASANVGREITIQNYQAQTTISASSNVVPQGGGAAGTAILEAVIGNWATLVSNGTNWVIMQAGAYNNLLLE